MFCRKSAEEGSEGLVGWLVGPAGRLGVALVGFLVVLKPLKVDSGFRVYGLVFRV